MGFLLSATKALLGISAFTVCTAGTLLYRYQRNLVYPSNLPSGSRTEVPTPDEYGIEYENITLETPDGEQLHAFLMPQQQISEKEKARGESQGSEETMRRRPTVLVLHANAGNMGHRIPLAAVFYKRFGCNVFMLSYRGYGRSTGQASEVGIRIDAQTALDYLKQHPVLKDTIIIAYGQSLGGAVAIDVASRNTKTVSPSSYSGKYVSEVTAEADVKTERLTGPTFVGPNRFRSIPILIPHVMPFIQPFAFLCREYWPSEDAIKRISQHTPVLFLTGRLDGLVPPSHMDVLMVNCTSNTKVRMVLSQGDHNDTCVQPGYFEAIGLFLAKYIIPLTTGGAEAAEAALSKVQERYQFTELDKGSGLIDVVPRTSSDAKAPLTDEVANDPTAIRQRQKFTSTDSDESEWIEMSARDVDSSTSSLPLDSVT